MSLQPLSMAQRQEAFGPLEFTHSPTKDNPENIIIHGSWVQDNIVVVNIPSLIGVSGANNRGAVQIHRKASDAIQFMFNEWLQTDLTKYILTWGGTFCPRLVRGSKTSLSNHAFGTAFDINMTWNGLGSTPAAADAKGTVLPLLEIAEKHGWFWGGHYAHRLDGMHFEYSITG